jgi:hypothetical protein
MSRESLEAGSSQSLLTPEGSTQPGKAGPESFAILSVTLIDF